MFPLCFWSDGNMWIDLREAATSGYPITGIMNPSSGPGTDGAAPGYLGFLSGVMGLGAGATYNLEDAKPTVRRLAEREERASGS